MRTVLPLALVLALFAAFAARAGGEPPAARHELTYSVTARAVTVVAAVTPYDRDPEVRAAFLHWFKRGFDGVLAGEPPLMIEWDSTAKGRAGRSGYDFGIDEARRFLKRKPSVPGQYVVPFPPA